MERMKRPNWSALPTEITFKIFSYHKWDFLFRLAIAGVCKEWRDTSRLLETIEFFFEDFNQQRCKVHGAYLASCMCAHNSLLRMIARSVALSNLEIEENPLGRSFLGNIRVWRYLNNTQNFHAKLENLCLSLTHTQCNIVPLKSSGVFRNLLSCRRLEYLKIEFQVLVKLDVQIEEGIINESIRYCELLNLSMTQSAIEWFMQACHALEELGMQICCHEKELRELQLHAPQLATFYMHSFGELWDDVIIHAPLLEELHVSNEVRKISMPLSKCLRSLRLQWILDSQLTSVITPNPSSLERLTIYCWDGYWNFEDVKACLDEFPMLLVLDLNCDPEDYDADAVPIHYLFSSLCKLEKLIVSTTLLEILEEEVFEEEARLHETGGRDKVLQTLKTITVRNEYNSQYQPTQSIGKFWSLWPNAKLDVFYHKESVMAEIEAEKNRKSEHLNDGSIDINI